MRFAIATLTFVLWVSATAAADVDELIKEARAALKKGDATAALTAANKAVEADAKSAAAVFTRGEAHAALRKPQEAIKDYEAAYALDPKMLVAIDRRGGERFKLGLIDDSI